MHRDDPPIRARLAQALLDSDRSDQARELLDALIAAQPDFRSLEGHLTYACAVAACGDREKARGSSQRSSRAVPQLAPQ